MYVLYYGVCIAGLGSETEHNLVHMLFEESKYNPLIRPVENISDPISVDLGVTLFQVISVVSSVYNSDTTKPCVATRKQRKVIAVNDSLISVLLSLRR